MCQTIGCLQKRQVSRVLLSIVLINEAGATGAKIQASQNTSQPKYKPAKIKYDSHIFRGQRVLFKELILQFRLPEM